MADIAVLEIILGDRPIGTLTRLPGDRNLFAFNQDYIDDPRRPTLSLSFKDIYGELITELRPTRTRLPPFFANLLPEGRLREYLAERAAVDPAREFFLLWALGRDLPGALRIRPADVGRWPREAAEVGRDSDREADREAPLRFSLAGVQLKFSAVEEAGGGLTIPADGAGGSWIVKLPSVRFGGVPENEYVMMEIARRIGIDLPETSLTPIDDIAGLPKNVARAGAHALAVKRFDRTEAGERAHVEDFAQVFGVYPEQKYKTASYRNIAEVIWTETGEDGVAEFIRRFVFNGLIGNGDMHLKNWSLIYPDGRKPALAPGYDFVSTIPYLPADRLALNFVDSKSFDSLERDQFARFAAKARLPKKLVLDTVAATVEAFADAWRRVDDLPLAAEVREAIDGHLETMPLWKGA